MAKDVVPVEQVAAVEPEKGFTGAEYNDVARSARLEVVRLMKFSFTNEADFLSEADNCKLSHGRKVLGCSPSDDGDNYVSAVVRFSVTAKHKRTSLMKCEADFFVMYEVGADLADQAKVGYCRNVGPFAAYPYFRAIVAQMAWNAGVQLAPLPAIQSTAHVPKKDAPPAAVVGVGAT